MHDRRVLGALGELKEAGAVHARVLTDPAGDRDRVAGTRTDFERQPKVVNQRFLVLARERQQLLFPAFLGLEALIHAVLHNDQALVLQLAFENVARFNVALGGIGAFLNFAEPRKTHALARLGQIAVAVAVDVEKIAVDHEPNARRRLGPEDQQAVLRLLADVGRLPGNGAVHLLEIRIRSSRGSRREQQRCQRGHPKTSHGDPPRKKSIWLTRHPITGSSCSPARRPVGGRLG